VHLHSGLTINGKYYGKGSYISGWKIYPFFLLHMGIFGGSGFLMAYFSDEPSVTMLFMHGGFAILVYVIFYLAIFGKDEIKWMFINAGLGLFGIFSEINLILGAFDKSALDYPVYVHIIPFLYYVLYTFLLRQILLDVTGTRDDSDRRKKVEKFYVVGSLTVYFVLLFI